MKGAKVLVVEDDPAVLRITTDLLQGDGCEVTGSMTLEEGWDKAVSLLPALVVCFGARALTYSKRVETGWVTCSIA